MLKKINKASWLYKFLILLCFALGFSIFAHAPKVHAFPNCDTANSAWVNVIVAVEIENADTSFNSFSSNFNFDTHVSVPEYEQGVPGNVKNPAVGGLTGGILGSSGGALGSAPKLDSSSPVPEYVSSETITAVNTIDGTYTHSCVFTDAQGRSVNGPTYDFVGPAPGQIATQSNPTPNKNDFLNCLAPLDAGNGENSASFAFDNPVLNNPALAGGTWAVSRVTYPADGQTLNGAPQKVILFVYRLPPPKIDIHGVVQQTKSRGSPVTGLAGTVVELVDRSTDPQTVRNYTTAADGNYNFTGIVSIGDHFYVYVKSRPSGYPDPNTDYLGAANPADYKCLSTNNYDQQIAGLGINSPNRSGYVADSGTCGDKSLPVDNNMYNFLFITPSIVTIHGNVYQFDPSIGPQGSNHSAVPLNVTVEVQNLTTSTYSDIIIPANSPDPTYDAYNVRQGDIFAVQVFAPANYDSNKMYSDYNGWNVAQNYSCDASNGIYRQQKATTANMSSYNIASGVCGGSASPSSLNDNQYNFLLTKPAAPPPPALKPFFNVEGGNVVAGISYSCSPNLGATIQSYNTQIPPGSGPYLGSFGQVAGIASNGISGFNTAENPDNSAAYLAANIGPKSALSFMNVGYSNNFFCVNNYYNLSLSTTPTAMLGSTPLHVGTYPSGSSGLYKYNRSGPLYISGQVKPHTQITIVDDSPNPASGIYISNDITYLPYSTISDLPLFEVITHGQNIYINQNVKTIEGVYIAEADSSNNGGVIYTCATDNASLKGSYSPCNTTPTLNVEGSVSATRLEMLRASGDANTATLPAENFIYNPEVWVPEASLPPGQAINDVQSLSSLPPFL